MESIRQSMWSKAKQFNSCDVLILGGGINGSALFRDLSLQGVQCVLVEKDDFASGATSKSSRMIHGGLRYLEHAEFKLVREALSERNWLLANASHYVHPLRTTIPIRSRFSGLLKNPLIFFGLQMKSAERGSIIVKMGLLLYDLLSCGSRSMPWHYFESKHKALKGSPKLCADIVCTATYWDAWISHPERLCVDMIADACYRNGSCIALNYVTALMVKGDQFNLCDELSGETCVLKPKIVVNATGPWIDKVNAGLGIEDSLISGTKGTHLVIDSRDLFENIGDRMIYYEALDGRICIVFRFMDKVIAGTTDIPVEDPDRVFSEPSEKDYILASLKCVFPTIVIADRDIVYTFCGVRPLQASKAKLPGSISRSHVCVTHMPEEKRVFPVFSMVGGKLTSFRAFAEQTADLVLGYLKKDRMTSTRDLPLPVPVGDNGVPLKEIAEYPTADVRSIVDNEWVVHLSDVARRRTLLTLLGRAAEPTLRELADVLGDRLGWDEGRRASEVQACLSASA